MANTQTKLAKKLWNYRDLLRATSLWQRILHTAFKGELAC
jgi:hypothetical protein